MTNNAFSLVAQIQNGFATHVNLGEGRALRAAFVVGVACPLAALGYGFVRWPRTTLLVGVPATAVALVGTVVYGVARFAERVDAQLPLRAGTYNGKVWGVPYTAVRTTAPADSVSSLSIITWEKRDGSET